MGYYVTYAGSFKTKPIPLDVQKRIESLDIDGIDIIEDGNGQAVDIYGYDKFHGDDWESKGGALDTLLPYVVEGDIEFTGEDGEHWCYKYDPTLGGFIYGNGRIVYDFDKEVWNFE